MTNNRKIGTIGLNIPVINASSAPKNRISTDEVIRWRAALPLADIGASSKKLYIALSELNRSILSPHERFAISELFRPTTKSICTALKKHYIEQIEPLTPQKLMIANLRQTLITELTDNYKTVLEELHDKPDKTEDDIRVMTASICRILYYLNAFLLCRYQLYAAVPANTWNEVHMLYKYAIANNMLTQQMPCELSFNNTTTAIGAYTRIIILAAIDPYQWRQKDQYSINKAIDLWSLYPAIYPYNKVPKNTPGIYVIDLNLDQPPTPLNFRRDPLTSSCIGFDLTTNVKQLKHLLLKLHSNTLRTRVEHPGDPELSVTIPTITKLIKIWSQEITRAAQRFKITAQIKVSFGLSAAYYFVNNEKEFNPRPSHLETSNPTRSNKSLLGRAALNLPIFEISEDDDTQTEDNAEAISETNTEQPKEFELTEVNTSDTGHNYTVYDYVIDNISTNGFCIQTEKGSYPPFQNGEIIVFKNSQNESAAPWSIGVVRWIKSHEESIYQIGIELIAAYAKAAGIQMVREDQPVGALLRCLILPDEPEQKTQPVLITPNLPIHSNTMILYLDDQPGIKTTIAQEIESTSTYHQYVYSTKNVVNFNAQKEEDLAKAKTAGKTDNPPEDDKTNTEFDSIWKDL